MNYELAKKLKDAGFPQYIERVVAAQEITSHNVPKYDHRIFDLSLMGYPKEESDYYTQGKWRSAHYFWREYIDSDECDILYFPTLSELIEACGDVDIIIFKERRVSGDVYYAGIYNVETSDPENPVYNDEFTLHIPWEKRKSGSTPEEAVANLWLELNKK